MKILCHIHTFNDEDVIEEALRAVMAQGHPVEEILLVDNASTDETLEREFPRNLTVIRHPVNTGTSGSVATGFRYAQGKGYDWIWILDADSRPREDALAKLVELYESFPANERNQIGALASRILRSKTQEPEDYGMLTPKGPRPGKIDPDLPYYECDSGIWSGTLFNMQAVRKVEPPRYGPGGCWEDFGLDWGDIEYFHRLRLAGYRFLVHRHSVIRHALGWQRQRTLFGHTIYSTNHSAFRRYLYFRNGVYFWFYLYPGRRLPPVAYYLTRHMMSQAAKILMMEDEKGAKLWAILRGAWAGARKKILQPY